MEFSCTLYGRPITKKNHQQIIKIKAGNRRMVIQSPAYRAYANACLEQLWPIARRFPAYPKAARLNLCARYWMPDRRSRPDLVGLLQATQDILQAGHIVEDDASFVRLDGSEIVGIDRDNPRVEIRITAHEPGMEVVS